MNFNYNKLLLFLLFFLNFISYIESNRQIKTNKIGFNISYPIFNKKQNDNMNKNQLNFSKNIHIFESDNNITVNTFSNWIDENTPLFIIIIVINVIVIIIIIVLIIVCRRMNDKFKQLQIQVNKISFQSDVRESNQGEYNDKLI